MTEIASIKNCKVNDREYEDLDNFATQKREIRESLKCPMKWENLTNTMDDNVRHCNVCEQSVYLITNDEELGRALRKNQCIAWQIPDDIKDRHKSLRFTLGRPALSYGSITRKLMFD